MNRKRVSQFLISLSAVIISSLSVTTPVLADDVSFFTEDTKVQIATEELAEGWTFSPHWG